MYIYEDLHLIEVMQKIIFFIVLLPTLSIAQVNLDLGLKAYYPFSGNANDVSGNHNNPVFNNATLTADRFGNPNSAYHFNGRNNYMQVPNKTALNMKKQMSISLWVKPTGFYNGRCFNNMLVMKGDADYLPGNYFLRFANPYQDCTDADTRKEIFYGTDVVAPSLFVKTGQWYNLIWTCDGTTVNIYVNCVLYNSKPVHSSTFTNDYDLFFGHLNNEQYPYWFNGDLDEIRIYNRALNPGEVAALCDNNDIVKKVPSPPKIIPEPKKITITKIKQPAIVIEDPAEEIVSQPVKVVAEKEPGLEMRQVELTREITVDHDAIAVTLYHSGEIEGDSVTLIYNDRILATHVRLSADPQTFYIKIDPLNCNHQLAIYAENLRSIPSHTALMVIYDGDKRYELNVRSTKTSNGAVRFRFGSL
jgi:hypothetical protein